MKKFIAHFDDGTRLKSSSMRRLNNMVAYELLNRPIEHVTFESIKLNAKKTYDIDDMPIEGDNTDKRLYFAESLANQLV